MNFVKNIKSQLATSIGLDGITVRTTLSKETIEAINETPPACIDPVIWKQAVTNNPDEKKMIPVPILGLKFTQFNDFNTFKDFKHSTED